MEKPPYSPRRAGQEVADVPRPEPAKLTKAQPGPQRQALARPDFHNSRPGFIPRPNTNLTHEREPRLSWKETA